MCIFAFNYASLAILSKRFSNFPDVHSGWHLGQLFQQLK